MIKYFCDCCKKEKKKLYRLEYLCHLNPENKYDARGYVDASEGDEPVSGRIDTLELCLYCYNRIIANAIERFEKMRNGNERSDEV